MKTTMDLATVTCHHCGRFWLQTVPIYVGAGEQYVPACGCPSTVSIAVLYR